MSRLLPQPALSLTLLLTWLLLVNSVDPGHIVLGALLGVLIPLYSSRFWPRSNSTQNIALLLRYIGRVLVDIIIANIAVARLILAPRLRARPGFIVYPLTLRDEFAIGKMHWKLIPFWSICGWTLWTTSWSNRSRSTSCRSRAKAPTSMLLMLNKSSMKRARRVASLLMVLQNCFWLSTSNMSLNARVSA